jgi:hypothetical protein
VVLGDVDSDGDLDLVVDNGVDGNGVYPNTGDGTCSGGIDKLITQHKLI